jgi:preprotein translocase subunit SecE
MASKVTAKQKAGSRPVKFFKNVWSELKKVSWPNKKEMTTYTTVVVVSVILMAVVLWVFDSVFSFLLGLIL